MSTAAPSKATTHNGSNIISVVEEYRRAGLQCIPIRTDGSKAPTVKWEPLQDPANSVPLQAFAGKGVAIIQGRASGGGENIDFDDPSLYEPWCEQVEEQRPGLIQRLTIIQTPRMNEAGKFGRHVAYRCPEPSGNVDLAFDASGKATIQTRGEGGYVVTVGSPPACHPSGRCYELLAGELTDLPMLTMEERNILFDCARALTQSVEAETPVTTDGGSNGQSEPVGDSPGDEFAASTSWSDILTPHGWTRIGDSDLWRRPGKEKGWSASSQCTSKAGRELLKVFSSNATPFAMNGKYNKFTVFAKLNHGGNFTKAAAALYERGFGKKDDSGVDASGILRQGSQSDGQGDQQTGQDHDDRVEKRQRLDFGRMTSSELFGQDFTVNYLIDGVLAEKQHGVISGRFKSQKTHIAVAAAISICTGNRFLNRFDVPETRRVGIFCGEGGPAPMQRMGRAICQEMFVDPSSLDNLFWFTRVPRVSDAAHRVALEDAIKADKLDVVFLDPTYLLLSGVSEKASNYMLMADALSLLTTIGEATGATMEIVHHNKKTSDFTVPDLNDLSFSGTAEWAGQWILLGHRAPFDANQKISKLWMNIGGRVGHGGLYGVDIDEYTTDAPQWHASVEDADEARQGATDAKTAEKTRKQQQEADAMVEKIKGAFRSVAGVPLTKRQLAERVGSNPRTKLFLEAIAKMINAKELEPDDDVKSGTQSAEGYRRRFPIDD
ncbi:MAG: AAA family ATPase [Pirellulaceae bacterium]